MDSMHAFETQRRTSHREEPANFSRSDASVRSESANLGIVRMLISRWCWACRRRLCQRSWDTPRIGQLIQTGRHPQLHFRDLLRLYSRYGLQGCSPAQRRTFVPRRRPGQFPARAAGYLPGLTDIYSRVGPPLTGHSYQRDLLKPPPPFATRPPPSPFGRASLTLSVFPSRSLPLRASIAFWASAS